MITDEIFHQLRILDSGLNENEFTTKYLKTSRSYLCNRRNKDKDVSNDVLLNLYSELSGLGSTWREMAKIENNERRRGRWLEKAHTYTQLAERVVNDLLERAKEGANATERKAPISCSIRPNQIKENQ